MTIPLEKKFEIVENDLNTGRYEMLCALYDYLKENKKSTILVKKALEIAFDQSKLKEYEKITDKIIKKYELQEAYNVLWY